MCAEPVPRGGVIGAGLRHELPERPRVIHSLQMHQLVNHHVVAHRFRHPCETPVQADVSASRARAPSPALIAHADARHGDAVLPGEIEKTRRQLASRAGAHLALDVRSDLDARPSTRFFHPPSLLLDPAPLLLRELARLTLRSPSRNRDAHRAVVADADDVPAGARVTNELGIWDLGFGIRWRVGFRTRGIERKRGLHVWRPQFWTNERVLIHWIL